MESEQKRTLILILISALLFAAGLLLPAEPGVFRIVCFLAAWLVCGAPVLWEMAKGLFHGEFFDETVLMSVATIGAIALGEYPEAAMVMILYELGEFLEDLAADRSKERIEALLDLRPEKARVLRDNEEILLSPGDVRVGETILVYPGERVPLDGKLLSDRATLDRSALTGESAPAKAAYSDEILSGSVALGEAIALSVTASFEASTLSRIVKLTEQAKENKSRREAWISRFARVYTPIVAICAVLVALVPILVFSADATVWIRRALNFLVISCPCALVISIPLTFFSGLGAQSRIGLLIKGASHLEDLADVSCAVFDKTGTLTRGVFEVTAIHPHKLRPETLIDLAALAESHSNHPIAQSILRSHEGHIDKSRVESVEELPGLGIRASIDGKAVFVGNARLMEQAGAKITDCEHKDGSVVHVCEEQTYCGHIVICDTPRENVKDLLSSLKRLGVEKTVMLTGDKREIGQRLAEAIGIDEARCELLPEEKLRAIQELSERKGRGALAFLGDGINDAPSLACADLGIAMGSLGSDAAVESADAVFMDDRLQALPRAIRTARKTIRIARENLFFALIVKFSFLALSLFGLLPMALAVFADVGVTLLCIANAARAAAPVADKTP